jgi:hypothetical protein
VKNCCSSFRLGRFGSEFRARRVRVVIDGSGGVKASAPFSFANRMTRWRQCCVSDTGGDGLFVSGAPSKSINRTHFTFLTWRTFLHSSTHVLLGIYTFMQNMARGHSPFRNWISAKFSNEEAATENKSKRKGLERKWSHLSSKNHLYRRRNSLLEKMLFSPSCL